MRVAVCVSENVALVTAFGHRIEAAGHEVVFLGFENYNDFPALMQGVECIVDFELELGTVDLGEVLGELQDPSGVTLGLKLCHGIDATAFGQFLNRKVDFAPLVGFSLVPPLTDQTVLELMWPLRTARADVERARAFLGSMGFEVVEVPDVPGGIAARAVACLINEAASALYEGVADLHTLDTAMKLGTNYPLGPLEWGDVWGAENVLAVLEGLFKYYGEDRYRPHPLLKKLVQAGLTFAQYDKLRRARAE